MRFASDEKQLLIRRVYTAKGQFVRFENIFCIYVTHAAATPVQALVFRQVGHEAKEVVYPGIVLIPVEQVDLPLLCLLRRIEWIKPLPLLVEE